MRDVLGYRARLGVVVPSTNTIMEPELAALAPPGVTVHGARMRVARPALGTEAEARAFIAGVRAALAGAVADVATAEPDRVLVGISALSFMGGVAGHRELKDALGATTATGITTAAEAATAALQVLGVRRLGLLSPHPPLFDAHYTRFFAELGYEVVTLHRLAVASALAIAALDEFDDPAGAPRARRRWRRGDRAGGHRPRDGPLGGRGGAVARAARARHQRGDALACPARLRRGRPAARRRSPPPRALTASRSFGARSQPTASGEPLPHQERFWQSAQSRPLAIRERLGGGAAAGRRVEEG